MARAARTANVKSGDPEAPGMVPEGRTSAEPTRQKRTRLRAGTLRAALKDVAGVVDGRNTIPILDCVALSVGGQSEGLGVIQLTASDLDIWVTRTVASDDSGQPDSREWRAGSAPFACAVSARALTAALAEIDGDAMVGIELVESRLEIRAGRARFRLPSLPLDDFPMPPPVHETITSWSMPCTRLADTFAAVEHAISSDETRYYLNGIYLHPEALELRAVATDGHRLARLALDVPDGAASLPPVIVARKTVVLLDRLLASAAKGAGEGAPPHVEVTAECSGRRLRFELPAGDAGESGGELTIVAKTIDGTFPDYTRVIPDSPPHRFTIDRGVLAEAVKRVSALADGKTRIVRAELAADRLTLSASSPDLGDASEELPCAYAGPDIAIGFDARYWRDALAAIASDLVAMRFTDAQAPVRIAGWVDGEEVGGLVQVLMPVRVP